MLAAVRALPSTIEDAYLDCRAELLSDLGAGFSDLDDADTFAIFVSIVAYHLAPYGNSTTHDLNELLAEAAMDCDNYVALTYHLYQLGSANSRPIWFLGWDGGVIGNHAQAYVRRDGTNDLLLDPTIALVARTSFDEVASGRPVPAERMVSFATRAELGWFKSTVRDALLYGQFRPSDILYVFDRFDRFTVLIFGPYDDWMTPGAIVLRDRLSTPTGGMPDVHPLRSPEGFSIR